MKIIVIIIVIIAAEVISTLNHLQQLRFPSPSLTVHGCIDETFEFFLVDVFAAGGGRGRNATPDIEYRPVVSSGDVDTRLYESPTALK